MAFIGRGSLPQNYDDFKSSATRVMRLPTPQPQFFFAKMAMGSRLSLAALNAGQQTAQQFVTMAGGGAMLPPQLDEMARAVDAYPGAILSVDEFGKEMGDTIKFDRDVYEGGLYTEAGRLLGDDVTISTTGQAIKSEQVPVVLQEFHGPSNAAGTSVQPYGIRSFDSKYRANKEALVSKATRYLGFDYTKWLDRVIRSRFIAAGSTNITFPQNIANAAAFSAGGNAFITLQQIMDARKSLSDREWSKFSNGRYMCLVPTAFNTQMIGDPDYRELSRTHADSRNQLFGYIGSVQDVDFFEVTTLAQYSDDGGDDIAALNSSTVGAGVTLQEALLFGPGCVGFGTAVSEQNGSIGPEVRFADGTNYGTLALVIWYALHAFQTLDTRGCQRIPFQST
jgi:N4-gp56 family major capsid protein